MSIYAVNIADMLSAEFPVKLLVTPVMDADPKNVVTAEKNRGDGIASLLTCPNERSEAIIGIVRTHYSKHKFRFYKSESGNTWVRV